MTIREGRHRSKVRPTCNYVPEATQFPPALHSGYNYKSSLLLFESIFLGAVVNLNMGLEDESTQSNIVQDID